MSEIHVLVPYDFSGGQAGRLLSDLQTLHERGVDLGTRGSHIQTNGDVLEQMADRLAATIAQFSPPLDGFGQRGQEATATLEALLRSVRLLAGTARDFPIGS